MKVVITGFFFWIKKSRSFCRKCKLKLVLKSHILVSKLKRGQAVVPAKKDMERRET